jgi:hypothetical protein
VVGQCKIKKWLGVTLFAYFFSAFRKSKVAVRAEDQQRKLNHALTSESLQTNQISSVVFKVDKTES